MNTFLIFILALLFISIIYNYVLFSKLKVFKNKTSTLINDLKKPLRKGYYKQSLKVTSNFDSNFKDKPFDCIINIIELDRFTNGESKIKIDYIEASISEADMEHDRIEKYIRDTFKSIVKSSEIEWLDGENSIKELRKEKLEKLKSAIK